MFKQCTLGLIVTLLTTLLSQASEIQKTSLSQGMHAKQQALQFAKDEQFLKAAQAYERAADVGLNRNYALWKAVNFYIKAEQPDLALPVFEKLARNGEKQHQYMQSLMDQYNEQQRQQLDSIIDMIKKNAETTASSTDSSSQIIVEDVDRFFSVFDKTENLPLDQQIALYEKHYFDQASPGMIDYASFKIESIEAFVKHVEKARPYYREVQKATIKLNSMKPRVIETMAAMQAYVPDAQPPNIYFIVGMHTSGGTASENGLLMGADFITDSSEHLDLIPGWTQPFLSSAEDKLWVIMHEYVHFLQNTSHNTVLGNALVEGGADFIANLLYGKPKKTSLYTTFGQQHESRIKKRFMENLDSTDISLWTGNNGDEFEDKWVPDLGYFIGHQIAQGYYQNASDKKQAIIDLLELKDPKKILQLSQYAN
ncbi:hypothetical protein [Marinicella sp. W31]|uniref:gliding motility protein GldB-related protein n=1 Tax=Marinicella sp. W31 TaxID=3023713 RepID=UPI0037567410